MDARKQKINLYVLHSYLIFTAVNLYYLGFSEKVHAYIRVFFTNRNIMKSCFSSVIAHAIAGLGDAQVQNRATARGTRESSCGGGGGDLPTFLGLFRNAENLIVRLNCPSGAKFSSSGVAPRTYPLLSPRP